jgi:hypothetical protein
MEEWKNKVISSLDGIKRAQPSAGLYSKIQTKQQNQEHLYKRQLTRKWIGIAASLIVVMSINLFFIKVRYTKTTKSTPNRNYTAIISNYNLYHYEE